MLGESDTATLTTTKQRRLVVEPNNLQSPWLTASEAAEYLGVSVRTIWNWVAERQIPVVHLPGRITRFNRNELDKWAQGFEEKPDRGRRR